MIVGYINPDIDNNFNSYDFEINKILKLDSGKILIQNELNFSLVTNTASSYSTYTVANNLGALQIKQRFNIMIRAA